MDLSKYQPLGGPLETNHFGTVHHGLEFEGQRDVRLIDVHERFAADPDRWQRVWQDVQEMMKCQHQNLVPVYTVSRDAKYVVTEWLPLDLRTAAQGKSLEYSNVRQVIHQACEGLAEIHARGLIHGDVRPTNLQLTDDRFVKVGFSPGLTFGGQHHQRQIGNRFVAPELFNPEFGKIGPQVDLYGLGFSALYLLLGNSFDSKFQVAGSNEAELENNWMHWQASPAEVDVAALLPKLPSDLRDVLHGLTRKHVNQRFATAAEVQEKLDASKSEALTGVTAPVVSDDRAAAPAPVAPAAPSGRPSTPKPPKKKLDKDSLVKIGILAGTLLVVGLIMQPWNWFKPDEPKTYPVKLNLPDDAVVFVARLGGSADEDEPKPNESGVYQLTEGKYRISATHDDYGPLDEEFSVPGELDMVAGLTMPQKTYDVKLLKMPADAAVIIRRLGGSADEDEPKPNESGVYQLTEGKYRISATHDDYGPLDEEFSVPGELDMVAGLTMPQKTYDVKLLKMPADASVTIERLGGSAGEDELLPNESGAYQLTEGQYRVSATLDGYNPLDEEFSVPEGIQMVAGLKMTPVPVDPADEFAKEMGLEFVSLEPRSFQMGLPGETVEAEIAQPFDITKHEITVQQFRKFVEETDHVTLAETAGGRGSVDGVFGSHPTLNWRNPGYPKEAVGSMDSHPVVQLTWDDASKFCEWLSSKTERTHRLPTEKEWEYACRAGTDGAFANGDDLTTTDANFDSEKDQATRVGTYDANSWGIYDMHGNVAEWCSDDYGSAARVIRGGAWDDTKLNCRSGARKGQHSKYRSCKIGFRVVRDPG